MFRYFIAFSFGMGSVENVAVARDREIADMRDVEEIQQDLQQKVHGSRVRVINWIQFPNDNE